eukprot:4606945-Prorocentrum_lima.AAC.1
MTSSLVGSEMCIRDRVGWLAGWAAGWLPGCLAGWYQAGKPTTIVPSERLSVSYTHLTLPTICSV